MEVLVHKGGKCGESATQSYGQKQLELCVHQLPAVKQTVEHADGQAAHHVGHKCALIVAYRRAVRIFDDTHADDIGAYIEWLSIFTYWALIFGVGCGLLTFLPDKYVFIWILSSIPFYSYLFYSYQNYLLFYEQVENAFEQDIQSEEELLTDTETEPEIVSEEEVSVSYTEIIEKVDNWIKTDGYVQQGLTIKELSEILHTNRTIFPPISRLRIK